jgi:competence protein ComFC
MSYQAVVWTHIQRGFSLLLETIAPKDPEVRMLEELTCEKLDRKRVRNGFNDVDPDTVCLYSYKDPLIKKAILEVKTNGNKAVARTLGEVLCAAIAEEIQKRDLKMPLLVPIPMTKKNERERGWNQCVLIAECAEQSRGDLFELAHALTKTRATEDQVGKGRAERFRNLRDCFKAGPGVKGRDIIVFDDIRTTGATLAEARKALEKEGARNILCIALAH